MKVRISAPAAAELAAAVAYLWAENPTAARAVGAAIERAIESLTDFPHRGRSGQFPGTRELPVRNAPYVVIYAVRDEDVLVLRIRHTSRDPSP
ncbi:MAG: type II toxin-antitoxin system RelE/ParE family toxin [Caulobacterales bacterium]|nr:type II toxin-antitoxin system RelE/ParE family toxin [Caulobacterales bacterium]